MAARTDGATMPHVHDLGRVEAVDRLVQRLDAEVRDIETLALPENRAALADLSGQWIGLFHDRNGLKCIVLDMDSSASPTHGDHVVRPQDVQRCIQPRRRSWPGAVTGYLQQGRDT